MLSKKMAVWLLVLTALLMVIIGLLFKPMPQPALYHQFADQRTILGVANAWDVFSNLLFAIAGIWGLWLLLAPRKIQFVNKHERYLWIILSVGLILTAFGSGYYHLAPNNTRLVWDRLPIMIVFMTFLSTVIAERINMRWGLWMWPVLLAVGIYSVLFWYAGEMQGAGDLRLYFGIQIYAVIAVLILTNTPSNYTRTSDLVIVTLLYALAKMFEALDRSIYSLDSHVISGHTLKHVAAAIAAIVLIRMVSKRKIRSTARNNIKEN